VKSISDNIAKWMFFVALTMAAFAWGVATVKWKVFPHDFLVHVESGFVAIAKMEKTRVPQHVIRAVDESSPIDPVEILQPVVADDLILMTGGFYYRQDQCPDFGCIAMIMDREGKILHSWEADPSQLFTEEQFADYTGFPGPRNVNVVGVALDPKGNLVVTFQGRNVFPYQVGVARFSWDGQLDWLRVDQSHHWPTVGDDGRVYTLISRVEGRSAHVAGTLEPMECKFGAVYQEGLQILSPEGEVLKSFWFDDLVREFEVQGLAYAVRDDCDPYHVNGIDLLNAAAAARIPDTREGDIVVSLRSSSTLIVMDQDSGAIKRIFGGTTVAQHSPVVLPNGDIMAFDNLGSELTPSGTRIVRVDAESGMATTLFPRDLSAPGADLNSKASGGVRVSDDGKRALIFESMGGRVIEFDMATGTPLWIFKSVSDLKPFFEKFDVDPGEEGTKALMTTQGASYLSRNDFARLTRQHSS